MISFDSEDQLQTIKTSSNEIIKWSEQQLKNIFGFDLVVWCNPSITHNRLSFNIDETEMSLEQWQLFSKRFNTNVGYSDKNLNELLVLTFGEADYRFLVYGLNEFYIIRDTKKLV
ncbi:hypothetical protein ACDN41_12355 [Priestia aryabhattai]|uniref:hypothetical protein n=1 Tax=Priestia aryabhattai TaxID=412384 RepID=UPI0035326680